MMKKKLLALALAATMIFSLVACGGGGSGDSTGSGDNVTITIFNSKSEIQDQFEELANTYSDTHPGVTIEVYYSSDTVSAHLAKNMLPTILIRSPWLMQKTFILLAQSTHLI